MGNIPHEGMSVSQVIAVLYVCWFIPEVLEVGGYSDLYILRFVQSICRLLGSGTRHLWVRIFDAKPSSHKLFAGTCKDFLFEIYTHLVNWIGLS